MISGLDDRLSLAIDTLKKGGPSAGACVHTYHRINRSYGIGQNRVGTLISRLARRGLNLACSCCVDLEMPSARGRAAAVA